MQSTEVAIRPERLPDKPKRVEIGPKLRAAIEAMVFEGLPMDQAARNANTSTQAIRKAFAKPHVIAYLRAQKQVFRESLCGANIKRLAEIRDAANNMPAVQAIKALEQLGDDADGHSAGVSRASPGLTIVVHGDAQIAAVAPKGPASD